MSLSGLKVAVIGLGYVGLPLAALCAKKGYPVVGLDTKETVVVSLQKKGVILNFFDSWVTSENNVQSFEECIAGAQAIVIVTEHSDMIGKQQKL